MMRQVHRLGDGLEVLVLAFLRRLVVVGHDLQLAIGADLLGEFREFDGLRVELAPQPAMIGTRPFGLLHRHADDFAVLLDIDRGRLAGGAHHADASVPSAMCQSISLRSVS
jgi:hypothetical protein